MKIKVTDIIDVVPRSKVKLEVDGKNYGWIDLNAIKINPNRSLIYNIGKFILQSERAKKEFLELSGKEIDTNDID